MNLRQQIKEAAAAAGAAAAGVVDSRGVEGSVDSNPRLMLMLLLLPLLLEKVLSSPGLSTVEC